MNSKWFDFDEDITSDFIDKTQLEYIKKNLGLGSKNLESKIDGWRASYELNDILDLATSKRDTRTKSRLIDSILKDRLTERNTIGRTSRFLDEPSRLRHIYTDDFFSDMDAKVSRIRSRLARSEFDSDKRTIDQSEKKDFRFESKMNFPERSSSSTSANSYGFADVTSETNRSRKDSMDSSWSKRSCQGNVTFPTSSASTISDGSDRTKVGRSVSRESDESVCTEKSVNSATVSEKLPDGTDKTHMESNESWLRKSGSGSKIAEKKVNDSILTEKNDDGLCEKATTRMSYLEKSATGSSLQEEMESKRMTSSSKGGSIKTVEQKTSSETYKKSSSSAPNKSSYYDELDSCSFEHFAQPSFSKMSSDERIRNSTFRRKETYRPSRSSMVSEKISKLIDEAVLQDDLFKIPSALQTDIDKLTDDFFNSKTFKRDKTRTERSSRLADLFSGVSILKLFSSFFCLR